MRALRIPLSVLFVIAPILCLLPVATAHAQSADDRAHAIEAGVWALQFAIDENFTLDGFDGSAIALKKHVSDAWAWRLAADVSVEQSTDDQRQFDERETGDDQRTITDDEVDETALGLDLVAIRTLGTMVRTTRGPFFYWGVGPTFSYSSSVVDRTRRVISGSDDDTETTRQERDHWSLGGLAVFGVEWFAASSLGLHAEYRLKATYGSAEITTRTSGTDETSDTFRAGRETTSWRIDGAGVRFGLSAYF